MLAEANTVSTSATEQVALTCCSGRGGVKSGTKTRESEPDVCCGGSSTGSLSELGFVTWVVSLPTNSVLGVDAVPTNPPRLLSAGNRGIGVRYGTREEDDTDSQAYTGEPRTTGDVSNTLAASRRSPSLTSGGEPPRRQCMSPCKAPEELERSWFDEQLAQTSSSTSSFPAPARVTLPPGVGTVRGAISVLFDLQCSEHIRRSGLSRTLT